MYIPEKELQRLVNIPVGTKIKLPEYKETLILGKEDFDEFIECVGRWITEENAEEKLKKGLCIINYIVSYDELQELIIVNSD